MNLPETMHGLPEIFESRGYVCDFIDPDYLKVTLPTGYIVSIVWGSTSYCTGRLYEIPHMRPTGKDAEVAVWKVDNPTFIRFEGWEYDIKGWVPVAEVFNIVTYLAGEAM